jgi:hypothetical protein
MKKQPICVDLQLSKQFAWIRVAMIKYESVHHHEHSNIYLKNNRKEFEHEIDQYIGDIFDMLRLKIAMFSLLHQRSLTGTLC